MDVKEITEALRQAGALADKVANDPTAHAALERGISAVTAARDLLVAMRAGKTDAVKAQLGDYEQIARTRAARARLKQRNDADDATASMLDTTLKLITVAGEVAKVVGTVAAVIP